MHPSDNIFIYGSVNLSFPTFFSFSSLTSTPSACSRWHSTDPSLYELIFFTYILLSLAFLPYRTLLVHCFLPCPTGNGTYRLFIGVGSATIDIAGDRLYPVTQMQRMDSTPSTTDSDTSSRSICSSTSPTSFDSTGTQSTHSSLPCLCLLTSSFYLLRIEVTLTCSHACITLVLSSSSILLVHWDFTSEE